MSNVVKKVLPIAATALGAYFGGPLLAGAFGTSAAAGTALGGAIGGLAGSALSQQKIPNIEAPKIQPSSVMPTPDSEAVVAQKRRTVASQVSRRGRASTILTQGGLDQGTTLGG